MGLPAGAAGTPGPRILDRKAHPMADLGGMADKAKEAAQDNPEKVDQAKDKIKDVAVIGLPHPRLGEIAAAIVEIKDGLTCTEEEINTFCEGMPRYKRPRRVIFDKVPRNPTGKIEKPVLREKYCGKRLVEAQITG